MANRLSHSQVSKWQQCSMSWKYWYIDKIRPVKQRAALNFGTALDRAITVLIKPNEEDKQKSPEQIFDYFWRFQEINGEQVYLPEHTRLVYSKNDYDKDLCTEKDLEKFKVTLSSVEEAINRRNEVGFDKLSEESKRLVNIGSWICLHKKGHYMIEAFRKKVLPRLKTIHAVQEYVELSNEDGDKVIGYADIVAEVEGYDTPVVLDLKTSAMEYEEDAVLTSPQLSLYVHALSEKYNTRKAGYIVLNKHLMKNRQKICSKCSFDGTGGRHKTCNNQINGERCAGEWNETIKPEVYVQFLVDDIPEQTESLVIENIDDINQAMKTGVYTRNLQTCLNNFGGPCDYLKLCYKGQMEGLIKNGK